jgi:hypothetical protein
MFDRFGNGNGHAAIFERARRIEPLVLDVNLAPAADDGTRARRKDEGRGAFA